MKLAIVIPYYKIDYFEETIKSISIQTDKRFTLYIGNDASLNNPLPTINKYLKENEYNYFEYKENYGGKNLALQWERILENVQEEWFQILGDDDIIPVDFVDVFYKNLPNVTKENISVIKFSHKFIDENGNIFRLFNYSFNYIEASEFLMKKVLGEVASSLSENVFRRDFYEKYRFEKLPLAWGSDDLAILSFSNFGKIFYINDTSVLVRFSEKSISGSESLTNEKENAIDIFRYLLVTKFRKYFPNYFVRKIIFEDLQKNTLILKNSKKILKDNFLTKLKIKDYLIGNIILLNKNKLFISLQKFYNKIQKKITYNNTYPIFFLNK